MTSFTYAQLKGDLQRELDLQDETFITADEFLYYFNEGVFLVSSLILTIYEDYFRTNANFSIVSGTASYNLPTDIYGQKIRTLMYNRSGTEVYEVKRIRDIKEIQYILPTDYYRYDLDNSGASGNKLVIYPTPTETSNNMKIFYIREAKPFVNDASVCDIPEFVNVIIQYVRWKCHNKEGHPDTESDYQKLEVMQQNMVETLTNRVPDEHTEIIKDFDFYMDFDSTIYGGY